MTVELEGGTGGMMIGTNTRTNFSIVATAHADTGLATCQSTACYSASAPRQSCIPCALGELAHSLMASTQMDLNVVLSIGAGSGQRRRLQGSTQGAADGALRMALSLNTDNRTARDNQQAFEDRSKIAAVYEALRSSEIHSDAYGALLHDFYIDMGGSIRQSMNELFSNNFDGKNLLVNLYAQLYGIITIPITATRLMTDIALQDADGVTSRA
eukprot:1088625-Prymnesium_polylepis.1